ncbi:glycosyl hydrolase family 28-related protein [Couchioplanes azureus]|uniref:glycosyl hydrolase family 28-related protein n=1 Tax=Couchioplanes caeruleus TaxID=56438 RepID=UPI0016709092|nr:glycosyl hydrolase family 28-related protein [Couchioplanes caeruleus]
MSRNSPARAAVLGVSLLTTVAAQLAFASSAPADVPDAPAYTLAPAVGDPALTPQDCAGDPGCAAAGAPRGGGLDDWAALNGAIGAAAARSSSAAPATVFLPAGVYTVTKPLSLPPNVNLRGSGMTATTLVIAPGSHANFNYSFLVRPDSTADPVEGSTNLVSDLAVNGNCKAGAGLTDEAVLPAQACDHGAGNNAGGGISAGDRWTVRHVRFTNLEYFKLWIRATTGVRAVDNRFDNRGGAASGDEDNIGGGGNATDTVVSDNQFDATQLGNVVDVVNARGLVVRRNTVFTDPAMLTRFKRPTNGSLYLEAVTDSEVSDNLFFGGNLVLKSNAGYTPTGTNKDVTNPARNIVRGNRFVGTYDAGITVAYSDYKDSDGTYGRVDAPVDAGDTVNHTMWSGGGNVITDNVIENSAEGGIVVLGCLQAAKSVPDTIAGNHLLNPGGRDSSFSTGCATFDAVGIGVAIGRGDRIYGNVVSGPATTWYGIQIGSRTAPTTATDTVLTDLSGSYPANSFGPLVVAGYRYGKSTPESPVAQPAVGTPGGTTLTWKEVYALPNVFVGGYRVYRGGALVADLPVGGEIPGNLMPADAATLENGLGGWTAASRTSVSRVTGAAAPGVGAASLALTTTGAGLIGATGPLVPVTAGQTYTAVASYQAQTTGRKARTGVQWLDASGVAIGTKAYSNNQYTVDGTDRWITSSYTAQAPAGAAYARVLSAVDNAVVGEVHLMDRIGLVAGTATEAWTDTEGTGPYDVVAYQVGGAAGSELSIPTRITAP